MKKKNLLFLASLIACVSTFGACDLFKTPEEETPPAQLPPPTVNDDFIDEDWQLSGNLSDYYYVNGNGDLQQELPQSVFEVHALVQIPMKNSFLFLSFFPYLIEEEGFHLLLYGISQT